MALRERPRTLRVRAGAARSAAEPGEQSAASRSPRSRRSPASKASQSLRPPALLAKSESGSLHRPNGMRSPPARFPLTAIRLSDTHPRSVAAVRLFDIVDLPRTVTRALGPRDRAHAHARTRGRPRALDCDFRDFRAPARPFRKAGPAKRVAPSRGPNPVYSLPYSSHMANAG